FVASDIAVLLCCCCHGKHTERLDNPILGWFENRNPASGFKVPVSKVRNLIEPFILGLLSLLTCRRLSSSLRLSLQLQNHLQGYPRHQASATERREEAIYRAGHRDAVHFLVSKG